MHRNGCDLRALQASLSELHFHIMAFPPEFEFGDFDLTDEEGERLTDQEIRPQIGANYPELGFYPSLLSWHINAIGSGRACWHW